MLCSQRNREMTARKISQCEIHVDSEMQNARTSLKEKLRQKPDMEDCCWCSRINIEQLNLERLNLR